MATLSQPVSMLLMLLSFPALSPWHGHSISACLNAADVAQLSCSLSWDGHLFGQVVEFPDLNFILWKPDGAAILLSAFAPTGPLSSITVSYICSSHFQCCQVYGFISILRIFEHKTDQQTDACMLLPLVM